MPLIKVPEPLLVLTNVLCTFVTDTIVTVSIAGCISAFFCVAGINFYGSLPIIPIKSFTVENIKTSMGNVLPSKLPLVRYLL